MRLKFNLNSIRLNFFTRNICWANRFTILSLGSWLCIGLLCCPTDNGGSGLSLAFNILTWMILAITLFGLCVITPYPTSMAAMPKLIVIGAVLWTLPLLWSCSDNDRLSALPHILALWALLVLLGGLRIIRASAFRSVWLIVIWTAACLQGGYGLFQTFSHVPEIRPMGVFYQPNLLASLLSTGLVCLLYQRWLTPGRERNIYLFRLAQGLALIFLSFMLVLSQSRTGWLGAIMATGVLLIYALRQKQQGCFLFDLCLIVTGISMALVWQHGLIVVSKQASSESRLLIIRTTWHLIQQHPWIGWGYGSFERVFGNQLEADRAGHGLPLIHPHNELLYAWAEGGVIALGGLVLMIAGVLRGLWQHGGLGWCGVALLLPLATHISLEYPLYQSVPHGLVLMLLLTMTLSPFAGDTADRRNVGCEIWLRLATLISSITVLIFMAGTLQTQRYMIAVEREAMMPLAVNEGAVMAALWNKYGLAERLDYDRHIALLMRFNQTRDVRLLYRFDSWATSWLFHHADTNVAVSRLMIARAIAPSRYLALCKELHRRYPDEPRISCSEPNQ
ncbi:TPA: O-antigen ligase family protein [Klebsiella aerogenes]|nr:O-antigen ligase family protein [Klebsiella aerogenes]